MPVPTILPGPGPGSRCSTLPFHACNRREADACRLEVEKSNHKLINRLQEAHAISSHEMCRYGFGL
jgi:hypothetical protein